MTDIEKRITALEVQVQELQFLKTTFKVIESPLYAIQESLEALATLGEKAFNDQDN